MYNPFDLAISKIISKIWDTKWISCLVPSGASSACLNGSDGQDLKGVEQCLTLVEPNMAMSQADGFSGSESASYAFFWRHIVWVHADVDMCIGYIMYIHIQSFSTDIPHTGWSNTYIFLGHTGILPFCSSQKVRILS